MDNTIKWSFLGCVEYNKAAVLQEKLRSDMLQSTGNKPGYLLLLEHKPVITAGRFGNDKNLLTSEAVLMQKGIQLVRTSRGGDYTFHGPGQLVCYPVINLRKIGIGVKDYVRSLESLIINVLDYYNINASRRDGYPGVWTGNKKIAFIGISVSRYITMHGFSLNYNVDNLNYTYMNPCGINGLRVTSMSEHYKGKLEINELVIRVLLEFGKTFNCNIEEDEMIVNTDFN